MFWLHFTAAACTYAMLIYAQQADNQPAVWVCCAAFCLFFSWAVFAFFEDGEGP